MSLVHWPDTPDAPEPLPAPCPCHRTRHELQDRDTDYLRDLPGICMDCLQRSVTTWAWEWGGGKLPLPDGRWTEPFHLQTEAHPAEAGPWPLPICNSPYHVVAAVHQWIEVSESRQWERALEKQPAWGDALTEAAALVALTDAEGKPGPWLQPYHFQAILQRHGFPATPGMGNHLLSRAAPEHEEALRERRAKTGVKTSGPTNGARLTTLALLRVTGEDSYGVDLLSSAPASARWLTKGVDDRQRHLRQVHADLFGRTLQEPKIHLSLRCVNGAERKADDINQLLAEAHATGLDAGDAADFVVSKLGRPGNRNSIKQRFRRRYA